MKRLIVGVIGLVAAYFFVLMAIAVLGIITAIVVPNVQPSRHIAAVHFPNPESVVEARILGAGQTHNPAATQLVFDGIKSTGLNPELTVLFAGALLFVSFLGFFFIAWRFTRRSSPEHDANSQTVQELYHLGKNLEERMESLETILLERSRPAL